MTGEITTCIHGTCDRCASSFQVWCAPYSGACRMQCLLPAFLDCVCD
jgi:hypothetical protein